MDSNIVLLPEGGQDIRDSDGFSRVVEIEKIKKENDYNLNVTLYVFPEEEVEEIDVAEEWREVLKVNRDLQRLESKIEKYLKELVYE